MTITELIGILQEALTTYGNVPVHYLSTETFDTIEVGEVEYCPQGEGVTIIQQWGPMSEGTDDPARLVLSSGE